MLKKRFHLLKGIVGFIIHYIRYIIYITHIITCSYVRHVLHADYSNSSQYFETDFNTKHLGHIKDSISTPPLALFKGVTVRNAHKVSFLECKFISEFWSPEFLDLNRETVPAAAGELS